MKRNFIKRIVAFLSVTCICVGFASCKLKDKINDWFDDKVNDIVDSVVEDLSTSDSSSSDDDTSHDKEDSSVGDSSSSDLHEHSYNVRYRVEPDCYTQGVKIYECSCGDVYMKKTPTYHIWGGDEYSFMCDICEETPSEWWVSEVYPLIEAGEVTEEEVESGDVWVRYYEG